MKTTAKLTPAQARSMTAALADRYLRVPRTTTAAATRRKLLENGWSQGDMGHAWLTDAGVLAITTHLERHPRRWREAASPVTFAELTEPMLALARRWAETSWCPQTVYPSRFYGRDFVGTDCLLISAAMPRQAPVDAATEEAQPLLTVLPSRYYVR